MSLDPSSAAAYGRLGAALSIAARPDEAIPHLEKALRLDPKSPEKWLWFDGMSWAHFAAGRYEGAVEWATRSVRLNPDDELGYRSLAASYAHLGRLDEARAAVTEELRIDPDLTNERFGERPAGGRVHDPDIHVGFGDTAARQLERSSGVVRTEDRDRPSHMHLQSRATAMSTRNSARRSSDPSVGADSFHRTPRPWAESAAEHRNTCELQNPRFRAVRPVMTIGGPFGALPRGLLP